MDIDKAVATQLANIEKRTGKTLAQLAAVVRESGLTKHGELVKMLKSTLGMGHGDANTLVHTVLKTAGPASAGASSSGPPTTGATTDAVAVLDGLYTGPKAALRPIHDALLEAMGALGPSLVRRQDPPTP